MLSNLGIQFSEFTQRVSWSNPTWDLFIVVFLLVGTLIYGFSMGRDRIIMIMVAVYMALVAVTNLPYVPQFGASVSLSNGFILKIGTFLGLFAILFFMLTRSALNHAIGGNGALGKWWHVLILSFLQVGMLISVVMSFLPAVWLEGLAALTRTVFVSAWGKFGWSLLPIFGLLVIGMSNERDRSNSYD
ncbi:MAG: hypothetical protein A2848_03450 [Candidatus Magasanikbacteria bacterium RIFCSPHIGHO2_01_FULL_50_8]|uniref:Uncharacterized protein n=2 Tax=Candidatus Magasanikiibacteriota TaxID=1752731 RepID=A0A1F6LQT1_9BACT|nr:MAG: hypothetical protein A2848_03450 [Candidatus Magasanikbacteria bacterium RIFCSPHIGHO2_01_FULL_50_8]OGH68077.1 MAG: hypothetical protein A3C15_01790 [Candidatus Magasanikbacteria bacterium RIFCSPHIGHO2_02_FULL_50_9b]